MRTVYTLCSSDGFSKRKSNLVHGFHLSAAWGRYASLVGLEVEVNEQFVHTMLTRALAIYKVLDDLVGEPDYVGVSHYPIHWGEQELCIETTITRGRFTSTIPYYNKKSKLIGIIPDVLQGLEIKL